jgi:hypothetical protein
MKGDQDLDAADQSRSNIQSPSCTANIGQSTFRTTVLELPLKRSRIIGLVDSLEGKVVEKSKISRSRSCFEHVEIIGLIFVKNFWGRLIAIALRFVNG